MSTKGKTVRLGDVARARSGDKGNDANIGVIPLAPEHYELLVRELTAERVAAFFASLPNQIGLRAVERYELPRVQALNFVLRDCLGGGASQSLRMDTQGKLLGTAILELELPWISG